MGSLGTKRIFGTPEERFWPKVEKTPGCWFWTAATNDSGYGVFGIKKGKNELAHRFAYTLINGAIQEGATIDHLCMVHRCVNPQHLEAVSQKVNNDRKGMFYGTERYKSSCPWGHEYSPENTYVGPNGGRRCKECNRVRGRELGKMYRLRKKNGS